MRRLVLATLAALLLTLIGNTTLTGWAATPTLKILKPTANQTVSGTGTMEARWTRIPKTLFYLVQVTRPDGSLIEHRYVPDQNQDVLRRDPRMHIDATQLTRGGRHTLTITAYGISDALIAEYGEPNPINGPGADYPTHLSLDWYTKIGNAASVTFTVAP